MDDRKVRGEVGIMGGSDGRGLSVAVIDSDHRLMVEVREVGNY